MADNELQVTFTLENEPLNAEFHLEQQQQIDADFEINVAPDISHLATKQELEDAVEQLEEEIAQIGVNIEGSALIDVQTTDDTTVISSKTFVFEQAIASNVWEITHNLNKRPSIQLVDSTGREFEAVKDYINDNQVVITLESATTGFAYLN